MDKIAFGNFLAELREEKGLTQEELAEHFNVSSKTISKWECGNSLPDLEKLTLLAEYFNVSLYELTHYKKITNPLISQMNIKKIINKNSIKKFIILKILSLILLMVILIVMTLSTIYTFNNYNQTKIYELYSDDDSLYIEGLLIRNHDKYYLSINLIKYTNNNNNHNINFLNDKTKFIRYSVSSDKYLNERYTIDFEDYYLLSDALTSIKVYITDKTIESDIDYFNFSLDYRNQNKIDISKTFKIFLTEKYINNKIIY